MPVLIEPSQLELSRPLTESSKYYLTMKNTGAIPITFKIKTTSPKQYSVRPNGGRIEPDSNIRISIILQGLSDEPPLDAKCKDKFLILSTNVQPSFADMGIIEMWNFLERERKDDIEQSKIKCVYMNHNRVTEHKASSTSTSDTSPPSQDVLVPQEQLKTETEKTKLATALTLIQKLESEVRSLEMMTTKGVLQHEVLKAEVKKNDGVAMDVGYSPLMLLMVALITFLFTYYFL